MFRRLSIIFFIMVMSIIAIAQNSSVLELEVITPENANKLTELGIWESSTAGFPLADFSPDGQVLALSLNDGFIQLLSTTTLEVIDTIPRVTISGDSMIFNNDGTRLLISTSDGMYSLWDVETREQLSSVSAVEQGIYFIPSSDLKNYYLLHVNGDLSVHDFITSEEILHIPSLVQPLDFFVPSQDDTKMIVTDSNASVFVRDLATNEIVLDLLPFSSEIPSDRGRLQGVGFTPHGNVWVNWQLYEENQNGVTSYSPIFVYDLKTGSETLLLEGEHWYHRLVFDPTETYVITIGTDAFDFGGDIAVWELATAQQIATFQGDAKGKPLSISPNGDLFAVALGSNQIRLFRITETTPVAILHTNDTLSNLEFNLEGNLLLNVGYDIRLWGIEIGK